MEIKSSVSLGVNDLIKSRLKEGSVKTKGESSVSLIEKGVEALKESRKHNGSSDLLDKQVKTVNELLETAKTAIRFSIHDDLGRTFVQVINQDSDEIIKEIPSEEFLDMIASMLKYAGLIVDEKI
ncbi:flagellar protein FlaG [Alkalihalobacillus oceani]|uniref:flagellar protein FlaG n=1 Tax=Halalkalibacter oceani TaxID=1653776 RepID=UPI00203A6813|nr:flagellar protein FlaG [Halalkalibacter oceani]